MAGAQTYEVTEGAEMAAGSWNSVVATWRHDGGQANLYLNGQGSDSDTVTGTLSDTLDIWLGSKAGGGDVVEAAVANLMVYNEEMTEAQALTIHRALIWTDILPEDEEWTASTVTTTYEYDGLYRIITATYSAGAQYIYTYDAVGNRQTMVSPEGSVSYTYDSANRLTTVGGVTYTWDDNGNLTSDGDRTYTYDHANWLTQVTEASQTTQFAYNGDGIRVSKAVDTATTQYVLDLAATLPVVISDTDAIYLYGLDIIAQQQAERHYYVHDGLGSVRQLVDSTGDMATNYAYDPFGVPLSGGTMPNPYRFTGEAWDAEVELLYLRARYYQPATGRFTSKDPWRGDYQRPATLNGYPYVRNNPVSRTDPQGLNGHGPDPLCPECHEALPGYSVFQAGGYAWFEVVSWFHELSPEQHRDFGAEHPLTQAVMRSAAVAQFRAAWSARMFPVPWSWKHSIDVRKGPPVPRVAGGLMAYAREQVRYALTADPVGIIFGSFNEISVSEGPPHVVKFLARNVMGRRSFVRFPGTERSPFHNVPLEEAIWGGTVEQFFHWEEPMPAVCRFRLGWEGPTRPDPQANPSEH